MTYKYIDTAPTMAALRQKLNATATVYLDTEFIRVSTYYPKLGLIQMHLDGVDYLIDPVADEAMTPELKATLSQNHLYVLHSCKEDLDVLQSNLNFLPENIFDTQVAASFLNLGASLGYGALVNLICGVQLEKDQTLTDWLARPLTEAQKQYAAADVSYLEQIYQTLKSQLEAAGKLDWFNQEMDSILEVKQAVIDVQALYEDISGSWMLSPAELAVLRELAAWRYQKALALDKPLGFILKEDVLLEIARKKPTNEKMLVAAGLPMSHKSRYSTEIISAVEAGLAVSESDYPVRLKRMIDYPQYKHDFKKIKQQIEHAAQVHNLPAELLGSRKVINQFLAWHYENKSANQVPKLLTGWRADVLPELKSFA